MSENRQPSSQTCKIQGKMYKKTRVSRYQVILEPRALLFCACLISNLLTRWNVGSGVENADQVCLFCFSSSSNSAKSQRRKYSVRSYTLHIFCCINWISRLTPTWKFDQRLYLTRMHSSNFDMLSWHVNRKMILWSQFFDLRNIYQYLLIPWFKPLYFALPSVYHMKLHFDGCLLRFVHTQSENERSFHLSLKSFYIEHFYDEICIPV